MFAKRRFQRTGTVLVLALVMALGLPAAPVRAWTRAGHMLSAAIAFDGLAHDRPDVLKLILDTVAKHPDRAAFEVAVGRSTGAERTRRIFMEMARWPDDIRGGSYDHPTWHYGLRPVIDRAHPPQTQPSTETVGEALPMLSRNIATAGDRAATSADRAIALCWIVHVVGDIHQPLHSAQLFSADYPAGDMAGTKQFVVDPISGENESLHWFWDDAASRSDEPDVAEVRALELQARYPRGSLSELTMYGATDAPSWLAESYSIASTFSYANRIPTGTTVADARKLPPPYAAGALDIAARRITLAGYRLEDALTAILGEEARAAAAR